VDTVIVRAHVIPKGLSFVGFRGVGRVPGRILAKLGGGGDELGLTGGRPVLPDQVHDLARTPARASNDANDNGGVDARNPLGQRGEESVRDKVGGAKEDAGDELHLGVSSTTVGEYAEEQMTETGRFASQAIGHVRCPCGG
jgi:hypothetical protein